MVLKKYQLIILVILWYCRPPKWLKLIIFFLNNFFDKKVLFRKINHLNIAHLSNVMSNVWFRFYRKYIFLYFRSHSGNVSKTTLLIKIFNFVTNCNMVKIFQQKFSTLVKGLDLFEGDIELDEDPANQNVQMDLSYRWPAGKILLEVGDDLTPNVVGVLHQAIR